jgi:hypothetical protein
MKADEGWLGWFTRGKAEGVEEERERIIKLLEEDGERNYISQETFDYVVSVIKGENNG